MPIDHKASKIGIAIPIYNQFPNNSERLVFDRILELFGTHKIFAIIPEGLNISTYVIGNKRKIEITIHVL